MTTKISWADETVNLWYGCDKIAPECAHCYIDRGLFWKGRPPFGACYRAGPAQWQKPYRLQAEVASMRLLYGDRAIRVFSCSESDFFNARADQWRGEAWQVVRDTRNLCWLILTKRPERIPDNLPADWGEGYPNVYLGVSAGCKRSLPLMDRLRTVPCALRFLSAEPLLEDVADSINLDGFSWAITGGESGTVHRPMRTEWAARLRDKVKAAGLPFHFKQVSAEFPGAHPDALGVIWHESPPPPCGMTWWRETEGS